MLAAGDELGHGQQGNNNPYCQDNAITWTDWSRADESLIDFTAACLAARRRWLPLGDDWHDDDGLQWLRANGEPLTPAHWQDPTSRTLGVLIPRPVRSAQPLLLLVHAGEREVDFQLPLGRWQRLLDSASADDIPAIVQTPLKMPARCVCLLQAVPS
jgi:glycogen operon protein